MEETQADGVRCVVQGLADEGTQHHNPDDDEEKGDDLGNRGRGDKVSENDRDVLVVPAGKQNTGDQPAKREELQNDPAQEGHNGGVGEQRDEKTVEEVHAVLGISKVGTTGNQAKCFEVLFAGTGDDVVWERGCGGLFVPMDGFKVVADVLLVEGGLRTAGIVGCGGPVAGGVGSEDFVGENNYVV